MPKPTWEVAITVEGEHVLTIGSNHLAGVENIDDYADTILTCAQHLVSFIGGETESEKFFREEEERTARNRDMWKGQCERQAEQLTAMHSLLRKAQAALEPFANFCEKAERFVEGRANFGGSPIRPVNDFRLSHFQAARAVSSRIKESLPHAE